MGTEVRFQSTLFGYHNFGSGSLKASLRCPFWISAESAWPKSCTDFSDVILEYFLRLTFFGVVKHQLLVESVAQLLSKLKPMTHRI